MKYYDIWPIFSIAIFILVAIYYWKGQYKYFFLFNSISDIISVILWEVFKLSSQSLWIPFNYLLLFSVDKNIFISKRYLIILGLISILFLNYFSTTFIQYVFVLVIHIILLFIFTRYFYKKYLSSNKLDLFYILMIIFEMNIIIRLLAIIREVNLGVNVFYASMIIQMLIGIFLIIIRKGAVISFKK